MKHIRTLIATTGAALALSAGAGLLAGSAAYAVDNGPAGRPGESCPVEDADGTVTQVPIGTTIGPLRCGADGEWHFPSLSVGGSRQTKGTKAGLRATVGGRSVRLVTR